VNVLTSNTKLLRLFFTFSSIAILPISLVPAPSYALPNTTFECRIKANEIVTVARRGDRVTEAMITWREKSFGSKYTPEKRCEIVSQRLTKAVANSGNLSNLDLTYGRISSIPVICFITQKEEKCNSENILFSLKASEKGHEREIINDLLKFDKSFTDGDKPQQSVLTTMTYGDAIENAFN
jgi:Circadian oscillating protein COP23